MGPLETESMLCSHPHVQVLTGMAERLVPLSLHDFSSFSRVAHFFLLFFVCFFFWQCRKASGILVPWSGIKPAILPAVKAWSLCQGSPLAHFSFMAFKTQESKDRNFKVSWSWYSRALTTSCQPHSVGQSKLHANQDSRKRKGSTFWREEWQHHTAKSVNTGKCYSLELLL